MFSEFADDLRLFGCLSRMQGLWSSVRASVIGRRRAKEEQGKRVADEKSDMWSTGKEESIAAASRSSDGERSSPGTRNERTQSNGSVDSQKAAVESSESSKRQGGLRRSTREDAKR